MARITYVIGGGTFSPIRNHLALAAPAFGSTAKKLQELLTAHNKGECKLVLTKMADSSSDIVTTEHLAKFLDKIVDDPNTGTIVLNAAICDYDAQVDGKSGWHEDRLLTSDGNVALTLTPAAKLIGSIRKKRPDIFLVGFKTTTNKTPEEQFTIALKMMKSVKCNLVLANDVVTRHNMVITAEESAYFKSTDRDYVLKELATIIIERQDLTYYRTEFVEKKYDGISNAPATFRTVVQWLLENGGYICNNGNGFTPGHFAYKVDANTMISSQRKADHTRVLEEGMTFVKFEDNRVHAVGKRKPSVGATSQRLLFDKYPEYDCIVHTHNPISPTSKIPKVSQKPFQCGSMECGMNTANGLAKIGRFMAVYLDKHGPNIMFKSTDNPQDVIAFIAANFALGIKVN